MPPPSPPPRSSLGQDSLQSSTPPSSPNPPDSTSSSSPPVHERDTCTGRGPGPCGPSTPRQPSQCSHKTCSAAPPTRPPSAAQRPTPGQDHRRKPWKEGHGGPSYPAPSQPHPQTRGRPSPPATRTPAWRTTAMRGCGRHPRMATKQSSPSIKAGPHPNKCRLRPPPPEPGTHPAGRPGPKARGRDPREPKRSRESRHAIPAPHNSQDPIPNPSSNPSPFPLPASDHRWEIATAPRPSMSGIVMELAEGGVWGWKDWGANRSPREPAPRLTPIGPPVCQVPTKEGGIGTSAGQKTRDSPLPEVATDPQQKGPSHKRPRMQPHSKQRSRPASPAQPKYDTQRRAHDQHVQPLPNPRARANRAPSPRSPAPDSSHNQTGKPRPLGQLGSQADPTMHHPAHYHAQGKDAGPASRMAPQKGPSTRSKEVTPPSRDADPPASRGTARTTNPKHTEPTRNHPANEQTPPLYEAETPDASAEPSDAHPATPTPGGHSRRAQDHHPNTTARHTVEDGMQQRASKAKAAHKAHTAQMYPYQPPKNEAPHESAPPRKEDPHHPGPRTCPTPIPLPTKGKRAHRAKTKTHPEAETNPPRDQPRPACTLGPCRPLRTPSPRQKRDQHPPPRQQNVLLEGRSTCNEMGPTYQFRRPLCPPIHQRSPSPGMHQPKTPATYPPGPKTPKAQPGPQPGGRYAPGTPSPKPAPDPPRSSTGTRPVTYVRRRRPPKSIACSYQMSPPRATKAPPRPGPQPPEPDPPAIPAQGHPKCPNPDTPPIRHNASQDEAKSAPPPLGDVAD
ncbi:basic proline-rich protein-like [Girardinichthys multiradiatus]|uniref:basic proline-rich protein-like n=1 Tax=Girardinichthys multiradiatus TaxID=208333 RepID=UPI001FAC22AA|nr:basic proline-rich protein-like [Girardinichthys multiradiatus]